MGTATRLEFCLLASSLGACVQPATEVVIRVDSDIATERAGGPLRSVDVRVERDDDRSLVRAFSIRLDGDSACGSEPCDVPGDVAVAAASADDARPLRVTVTGTLAGGVPIERQFVIGFSPHRKILVDAFLADRCRSAPACPEDATCGRRECEPIRQPVTTDFVPLAPRDGSRGGNVDDASDDAPPASACPEAVAPCPLGSSPTCPGRSCRQILEAGAARSNGAYYITAADGTGSRAIPVLCDMTSAGGGWTLVGRERAMHAGALRYLGWASGTPEGIATGAEDGLTPAAEGSDPMDVRLTWGSLFAQFRVLDPLFVNSVATAVPLQDFATNEPRLAGWVAAAGGAVFCRATQHPDVRPGDTSWAIKPRDDANQGCGCNGGGWAGRGAFYGGFPAGMQTRCDGSGGGWAGVRDDREPKGGITSGDELMIWTRSAAGLGTGRDLATPCTVGIGRCATRGAYVCAAADGSRTACGATPLAGSDEVCNLVDDDCDGLVDEVGPSVCGRGACARSVPGCVDGAPQACVAGGASPETCNNVDDNCDGAVDENLTRTVACARCGRQGQRCAAGAWVNEGGCTAQGACDPGATGTQACGCGGTQRRTCGASCAWGGFGACSGEGPRCTPGQRYVGGSTCGSSCARVDYVCPGNGCVGSSACGSGGCANPCSNAIALGRGSRVTVNPCGVGSALGIVSGDGVCGGSRNAITFTVPNNTRITTDGPCAWAISFISDGCGAAEACVHTGPYSDVVAQGDVYAMALATGTCGGCTISVQ